MKTEPLPPNLLWRRPISWRKQTLIIACTAIVCTLIFILYIRLENVTRDESGRRYEPELTVPDKAAGQPRTPKPAGAPVPSGTCGGLFESNVGKLKFFNDLKQDDADTLSLPYFWIIQLRNETNIRFTLNGLSEDAHLNLYSGDQLASCITSKMTKRLNSTQVGSSFEFLGKTLIVVLPSSSASAAFSWRFWTTERIEATGLPDLETNKTAGGDGGETLPDERQNLTVSQGTIEGIIAGTGEGVIIIPLASLEQRKISSTHTTGVAFNWQSRKIYCIEDGVGIKIANLDGSSAELIIGDDTSYLFGLAVDQITGNFYYGVRFPKTSIQVCDSMGKKCATVVSGVNSVGLRFVYDIALFPLEGLMFWSSADNEEGVIRANMDGTNSFIVISEHLMGLFVHEFEEKLYWTHFGNNSIGHDGYSRNILFNASMKLLDIAVDGDTLYFSGYDPTGVYSVTGNRTVSTIANTAGYVNHIVLYGRNKVPSRQNPCENSPCVNLCVLNHRLSYSCL